MINRKKIEQEIVGLSGLQALVQTYQEIAATRMRKVKDSVLENRVFLSGLTEVYQQVKYSYRNEVERLTKKKGAGVKVREHNNRTVSLLLSANTMLYGDILRNTFNYFANEIRNLDTDVAIVGRVGLQFFLESGIEKKYQYFDFSDSGEDEPHFNEISEYVSRYEKAFIYHSKFEDILSQKPDKTIVTGYVPEASEAGVEVKYLFEPSLEKVLAYFENEILASFLEQAFFESNLSKFAARMINLDSAVESIKNRLKEVEFEGQRLKHIDFNKKQQTRISGIQLWSSAK